MKRIACLMIAFLLGCETNNIIVAPDQGATGPLDLSVVVCTPNTRKCDGDAALRCSADGATWIVKICDFGEICVDGECELDLVGADCNPGEAFCVSDTGLLQCDTDGTGFVMKSCPANTVCAGEGQCVGACVVGDSLCAGPGTVSVCADGQTYTNMACPSGQLCAEGSCMPAKCTPGVCAAVCGNKAADPNSSDPAYTSVCLETPLGWRWLAAQCVSPATCDPTAACNAENLADACTTECTPDEVRCVNNGAAKQTCGSDGKWGGVVACDTAPGKRCVVDASFQAIGCGDAICDQGAPGGCVVDGGVTKLRACANGVLAAAAMLTTCNPGLCIEYGADVDPTTGLIAGKCDVECNPGDSRCVGGANKHAKQDCGPNGVWSSATTQCGGFDAGPSFDCYQTRTSVGPRAVCGVCDPDGPNNRVRCTDGAGTPSSDSGFQQVCDANGQWGAVQACVASYCQGSNGGCGADCIPGKLLCTGDPVVGFAPLLFGTEEQTPCTADGRVSPTPMPCPGGTSCRTDPNGNAYGCVICVGTQNEGGIADTRCSSAAGAAGSTEAVQVCKPTSDGWQPPTLCIDGFICRGASNPTTALPVAICGACPPPIDFVSPCTETAIRGLTGGEFGCADLELEVDACGTTSDCCVPDSCTPAAPANPAACGTP